MVQHEEAALQRNVQIHLPSVDHRTRHDLDDTALEQHVQYDSPPVGH